MPLYNTFKSEVMKGSVAVLTDTIKIALLADTYTPNEDTHDYWDDVSANEVSGTGYTAGGATLGTKTCTVDTTDNEGVFDAADVTWGSSTITARYAVIYKSTGTPSTSLLIGYIDFGSNKSSSNGNFTIQWATEGIINIT